MHYFCRVIQLKKEPDASGRVGEKNSRARATSDSSTITITALFKLVKGDTEKYIPKEFRSDKQYSQRRIIGPSGKDYGICVYLDSELLTKLTDSERKEMVKLYVTEELAGQHLAAYDSNNKPVDIRIAEKNDTFVNNKGKKRNVLEELYKKYEDNVIRQEALVLADELISSGTYEDSKKSSYSHDWLDDNGNNDWEYWKVYLQEKNKTVWSAMLNIANTANGEKLLYDISKIKMVEGAIASAPTSTNPSVSQSPSKSSGNSSNSDRNS